MRQAARAGHLSRECRVLVPRQLPGISEDFARTEVGSAENQERMGRSIPDRSKLLARGGTGDGRELDPVSTVPGPGGILVNALAAAAEDDHLLQYSVESPCREI